MKKEEQKSFWRYGIMKYKDGCLGVHEIYWVKGKEKDIKWTENPVIVGDTKKELLKVLEMIKKDIEKYPVLDYEIDK